MPALKGLDALPADKIPGVGEPSSKSKGGVKRVSADLFHPVRTRRTFEDVVEQIVTRIQSGELREGDFLPGERALASSLEVSRPTVRLAINMLAKAGVVNVHPGRGGGIELASEWIPEDLLEQDKDEIQPSEVFAGLEARRALEPRVAQLAALRATDQDFEVLQECIEVQKAAGEDWRKALQADMMFHRRMWQAARNKILEEMMGKILAKLSVPLDMSMRTASDRDSAVALHERTLAALTRGDMDEVDAAMDAHMSYLENICEDVFGRRRVRELPDFLLRQAAEDGSSAAASP